MVSFHRTMTPLVNRVLVGLLVALPLAFDSSAVYAESPVKLILDTDFGDDGDDSAALAVMHHLADLGEVEILAVGQSNSRWDAPEAIDVINTYYGRPDIPIGIVKYKTHEGDQYSSFLVKNYEYELDLKNVPDVVKIYRQALALGWRHNEKYEAGFDLAALLVAARGAERYFNTKLGCNQVDKDGANTFVYDRDCGHRHVDSKNRKVPYEKIGEMLEEMMLAGPRKPTS